MSRPNKSDLRLQREQRISAHRTILKRPTSQNAASRGSTTQGALEQDTQRQSAQLRQYSRGSRRLSAPTTTIAELPAIEPEEINSVKSAPQSPRPLQEPVSFEESHSPLAQTLVLFGIKKATPTQACRLITDADIPDVITKIKHCTAIEIDLQRNKISGVGATHLCEYLQTHHPLKSLNLSRNKTLFDELPRLRTKGTEFLFPNAGAAALSALLSSAVGLKTLRLSECRLTDVSAAIIANGLFLNKTLEFLDLGWNAIEDEGANHIFKALLDHPTLQHLILDNNQLSNDCTAALLNLLRTNPKITYVKIDENEKIAPEILTEIELLAKQNWHKHESTVLSTKSSFDLNSHH